MPDLTKMSVEALCGELWNNGINWSDSSQDEHTALHIKTDYRNELIVRRDDILAELTRRCEVPAGHVKLDDGRVVKVLGELPITADGCLAEYGRVYWCWCHVPIFTGLPTPSSWRIDVVEKTLESCDPDEDYEGSYTKYPASCFSTREAAERAATGNEQ